jgi:hypothetical protein
MVDLENFLSELEAQQNKLPPVHLWQPNHVGEIDIRIDRQGRWFHDGIVIRRAAMIKVFASVLRRENDDYFLVTPQDKLRIVVEDVPFVAVQMEALSKQNQQQILFITNVGDHVIGNADHPIWIANERPYVVVRDGLHALISRSVYYRLVDLATVTNNHAFIQSAGENFDLGAIA